MITALRLNSRAAKDKTASWARRGESVTVGTGEPLDVVGAATAGTGAAGGMAAGADSCGTARSLRRMLAAGRAIFGPVMSGSQ